MPIRARRCLLALGLAALVGCRRDPPAPSPLSLSAEQRAEIAKVVDDAWARAERIEGEGRAAARAALASMVPRPELGACPLQFPELTALAAPTPEPLSSTQIGGTMQLADVLLPVGAPSGPPTTRIDFVVRSWKEKLDKPFDGRESFADLLARARRELDVVPTSWVVLLASTLDEPKGQGGGRFARGRLKGMLYTYSAEQGRVVCGAPVDVTNGAMVHVRAPRSSLILDLEVRGVLDSLKQLAPLAPAAPAGGAR